MTMTEANSLFSKLPYAEARHRLAEECRANGVDVDEANASVFELLTGASSEKGMKKERDSDKGNPFDDEHGGRKGEGDGNSGAPVGDGDPSSSESDGEGGNPSEPDGDGKSGEPVPLEPDKPEPTPAESKSGGDGDGEGNNGKRKRNTPSWKSIAEQQKKELERQKREMDEKLREAEKKSNGPQSLDEIDEEIKSIICDAYDKTKKVLSKHIDLLHRLAGVLFEREKLDADEFLDVMNGKLLPSAQTAAAGIIPAEAAAPETTELPTEAQTEPEANTNE